MARGKRGAGRGSGDLEAAFREFLTNRSRGREEVGRWLAGGSKGDIRRLYLVSARIRVERQEAHLKGRFVDLANEAKTPAEWLRRKSPDDFLLDLEILRAILRSNPREFRDELLRHLDREFGGATGENAPGPTVSLSHRPGRSGSAG